MGRGVFGRGMLGIFGGLGGGGCLLLAGAGGGGLGAEVGVVGACSQGGPCRSPGGQPWGYGGLCHTLPADNTQQETSVCRASPLRAGMQAQEQIGRREISC